MRLKKRLFEEAINQASTNDWEGAITTNRQLLQLDEDADCYNRIGKALLELGRYGEAHDAYAEALRLNPSNVIAHKNLNRLRDLVGDAERTPDHVQRHYADPQTFIVETGKTALTTLTNVPSREVALRLVSGEQVDLLCDERTVSVLNSEGQTIGQLEPLLAQRLITLSNGGNRYIAAIANLDGHQIKVLIREVFQTPQLRTTVSFPGKLGGDIAHFRTFSDLPTRYEIDSEDLLEDEELAEEDDTVEVEDEFFRSGSNEEEEVRLEELEPDIGNNDDEEEES
jgi:tetratricopeptide (TPR) repeat protein